MFTRYVCEYCGKAYKTKEEALACEERAKEMKPRFKKDDIVTDENFYKYKVFGIERWRMDFDKVLEEAVAKKYKDMNLSLYEHTFLCTVEALGRYDEEFLFTPFSPYAILKQPLPRREGIMLENERWLCKCS